MLYRPDQVGTGLPIFENVRRQYDVKKSAESGTISADTALTEIGKLHNALPADSGLTKLAFSVEEMSRTESEDNQESTRDIDFNDLTGPPNKPAGYDFFISYSHVYTPAVKEFVSALYARNPSLNIFYDRTSIPPGGLWIKMISDAIQKSRNVVCLLTPEYSQSAVCWDEFQCAYIMEKRKKLMIRTINFRNDVDMPPMMAMYSYIDCTEGDLDKLKAAVDQLTQT